MGNPSYSPALGKPIYGRTGPLGQCCCDKGGPPPFTHACGSVNTCNYWCDQTKAAITRGQRCACPCSDRRDYPPFFKVVWTGIGISLGTVYPDPYDDPGTTYYLHAPTPATLSTEALVNNNGGGGVCYLTSQSFVVYTNQSVNGEQVATQGFNVQTTLSADCKKIRIQGQVVIGGGSVGAPGGGSAASFDTGFVDRCMGGSGSGVNGFTDFPWVSSGGSFAYEPYCKDCDGNPVAIGTDDASQCAAVLTADYEYWDGAFWVAVHQDLDAVAGGYAAGEVVIVPNTSFPGHDDARCCPNHDCEDCTDTIGTCETCWKMIINVLGCILTYYNQGSCPPVAGWELVSVAGTCPTSPKPPIRNLTLTYGTTC